MDTLTLVSLTYTAGAIVASAIAAHDLRKHGGVDGIAATVSAENKAEGKPAVSPAAITTTVVVFVTAWPLTIPATLIGGLLRVRTLRKARRAIRAIDAAAEQARIAAAGHQYDLPDGRRWLLPDFMSVDLADEIAFNRYELEREAVAALGQALLGDDTSRDAA